MSDFDYGTGKVSGQNIFDTTTTGMSYYDQLIPGDKENEYMRKNKNLQGGIVKMSPMEYYTECANNIFDSGHTVKDLIKQRTYDKNYIKELEEVITKKHTKYPMPYLNYAEKGQEGLHRMYVAGELFGWDTKFPVLVIDYYDKELADRRNKISDASSFARYDLRDCVSYAREKVYDDYYDGCSSLDEALSSYRGYIVDKAKEEFGVNIKVDTEIIEKYDDELVTVILVSYNGIDTSEYNFATKDADVYLEDLLSENALKDLGKHTDKSDDIDLDDLYTLDDDTYDELSDISLTELDNLLNKYDISDILKMLKK